MNKILSWKINSGVYAYIYPVNNGKYISNRIPENSPIWEDVIAEVSRWDEKTYHDNFDLMNEEIKKKYAQEVAWDPNFFGFVDDNVVGSGGVNIVLLAGEGGCDGSGNGDGDISGGDGDISSEVYDKFNEYIDQKLEEERSKIEAQNENVKQYIEDKVSETIDNARETIRETKEELNSVRNDLEEKLESAQNALNKASALFDLAEGGISPDDIKTCLSSVDEYGKWINTYSGDITTLKTDYDLAGEKLGSIGEAEDVTDGFFTRFATSLNVMDTTVGNVERWMVASAGTVGDMASWYNTNASSATEAIRMINASASQISDVINYIKGDEITVQMQNVMDAAKGEWLQEVKSETELGISNVERRMDAFSASIIDQITYLAPESALTSMGERMDAMDFEMEQWMTKTDSAMTTALDIRESWSAESGRLSTVANLVAETDSAGNVLYFASGMTNDNSKYEKIVTITDRVNDNGERIFVDEVGNEYFEPHVYTHLSPELASYIQQTASGITFSAMGDDGLTAAIKLAIENDKSIISMIADEVVIDANVIAKEIESKKATLGGIVMTDGLCYSLATNENGEPLFKFDGTNGTIYASDGNFRGHITATTLTLGNQNKSIEDYIDEQIPSGMTSTSDVQTMIENYVNSDEFKNSITNGYVTEDDLDEWAKNHSGLTEEQIEQLKEALQDTEINVVMSGTTESGVTTHIIQIGDKTYEWKTYDAGDFLVLGSAVSGSGGTSVLIDKNGLLQANNAIIYGAVYASEGRFQGEVTANSLTVGNMAIDDYIQSQITGDDGKTYLALGEKYDNLEVTTEGLIVAKNAVVSGTVYAENGYFAGNLMATSGKIGGFTIEGDRLKAGSTHIISTTNEEDYTIISGYEVFDDDEIVLRKFYLSGTNEYTGEIIWVHSDEDHILYYTLDNNNNFIEGKLRVIDYVENSYIIIGDISMDALIAGNKEICAKKYLKSAKASINEGETYYTYGTAKNMGFEPPYEFSNTTIKNNGALYSKMLYAENGYFNGEINATGVFRGTLDMDKCDFKNVTTNNINSDEIVLNETFSSQYFNIINSGIAETYEYYVTPGDLKIAQTNNNNTGDGYIYTTFNVWTYKHDPIVLTKFNVNSGDIITIPPYSVIYSRFVPKDRTVKSLEMRIYVSGPGVEYDLYKKDVNGCKGKTSQTGSVKTSIYTFTANTKGTVSVNATFYVHLSDSKGRKKSSFKWYAVPDTRVKIKRTALGGFNVFNNGFSYLSPNKKYGIEITNNSIKLCSGGTWYDFASFIKSLILK